MKLLQQSDRRDLKLDEGIFNKLPSGVRENIIKTALIQIERNLRGTKAFLNLFGLDSEVLEACVELAYDRIEFPAGKPPPGKSLEVNQKRREPVDAGSPR
jgi:hypothetical protein